MTNVRYSICITTFNNVRTIRESLNSILNQVDNEFEIVVVDAGSNDGALEILKDYQSHSQIRLIVAPGCSRGIGRQIAFNDSKGDYVVSNMDTDDVFNPILRSCISGYHARYEGKVLRMVRDVQGAITMAPRWLLTQLGGWRNLTTSEDEDLWKRANAAGKYAQVRWDLVKERGVHKERGAGLAKVRFRYVKFYNAIRVGATVGVKSKEIPLFTLAWILAVARGARFDYGPSVRRTDYVRSAIRRLGRNRGGVSGR